MINIIVVLPKPENAKSLKNILVRSGFLVTGICTTGAQAISQADGLHEGIVICGYKLADMVYSELHECLPDGFEMMLLASQNLISECRDDSVVCLAMPLKVDALIEAVNTLSQTIEYRRRQRRQKPASRSRQDEETIRFAKELLMDKNNMNEEEAHRYLQKCSMDSGTNLVETAQMILAMNGK